MSPPEAEYPFKRDIEKGKYDKAEEKIRRRIGRDSANLELHYAAYRLYSDADYARRNLDTAYWHLTRVRYLYAHADEKKLERWARDSYSGARIDYDICRLGELDIIARQKDTFVFVEVKLRREGGFASAAEAVTPAKQRRLEIAAEAWLAENGLEDVPCRFDIIEVYLEKNGSRIKKINHLEEAFRP